MIDDKSVAEYLRLTPDQVRLLRDVAHRHECQSCTDIHPTYPQIKFLHHPGCPNQDKCADCGGALNAERGHEVGLICNDCCVGDGGSV